MQAAFMTACCIFFVCFHLFMLLSVINRAL
nr:MAG TPA: coiled-coil domain-containing protein [Caudoviricetes sp.]